MTRIANLVLALLVACVTPIWALQADLAGIVDWHKQLIGTPLLQPTPPTIVDTSEGKRIVGITSKNVFASLHAQTGEIAWRHLLEDADPVVSYHVHGDNVLLLSGPSSTTARLFSLSSGQVQWEKQLHSSVGAHLTSPVSLGTDVSFTQDGTSVVILSDGRRLTKLDLETGKVAWSLDAPGAGDTVLFNSVLVSGSSVHVLAITSAIASNTLTTLTLSLDTSAPLGDFTQIPSMVLSPDEAFLAGGGAEGSCRVIWLEQGRIRSTYLSAAGALGGTRENLPGNGMYYGQIIDVGLLKRGYVLGKKRDGAVQVVDLNDNGGKIVQEFENSRDSPDKSSSVYSGAISETGVTFSRVHWNFNLGLAAAETISITTDKTAISLGFTFPFDTIANGVVIGTAVNGDVGPGRLPVLFLATSSGALQLVTQEATKWSREESLADIAAFKFIDLGEREVEEVSHVLAEESFIGRVTRHLTALKDLPAYIFRFASRFASASYTSALVTIPLNATNLHRDQFGFQKLIVAATTSGKLFAFDTSNGNAVWSKNLGKTGEHGSELHVESLWQVREVGDGVSPTLAVIATRTREEGVQTVGFHIDAFTGEVSGDKDSQTGLPFGKEIFAGRASTAFLTPFANCGTNNRVLSVVDESKTVYIFPVCKKVAGNIAKLSPGLFYSTSEQSLWGTSITGYAVGQQNGTTFGSSQVWSVAVQEGETLYSSTPATFGTISSYGRVTGDKSTLYKYLNPHLLLLTTLTQGKSQANIYVIDTITGRQVFSTLIKNVVVAKGVKVTMTENWLVYSWLDKNGWRIGSTELYEDLSNRSSQTPETSSFAKGHDVLAYSRVFVAPSEITLLETTTSKFAITAKDLIYVNNKNQIASIPRRLLDPRRPIGKPTSSDKEEFLIPYDPFIAPDSKRVISHRYQILGIKGLASSPALVESTSLLLAHGLDLFLTRGLNPSGTFDILTDSFNKAQLLLTLAVLSAGIVVARPAVRRKALKAKWF